MPYASVQEAPTVFYQCPRSGRWRAFREPCEILSTSRVDEVRGVLQDAEGAADRGLVAWGFLSYEAATAFDDAFRTRPPGGLPLAWFALFDPASEESSDLEDFAGGAGFELGPWGPSVERSAYTGAIERIHGWIAAGETYQVNYTLRLRSRFAGSALAYFEHLALGHPTSRLSPGPTRPLAARALWIDTGRHALCSLSPELFFDYTEGRLTTRPMKGTAARGRTLAEDRRRADALGASEKNRAENLMIVDMMRNDLGRIARPGTVEVPSLWEVERYPTLFQMTSTCTAEADVSIAEVMAALFPSASITGAPKARTTQLITELEDSPRGVYTGAIGSIGPGRRASFNVAIRTVQIDREAGLAEYGTGGGIVWDSIAEDEYAECLTKALVVTAPEPRFSLLETLRWDPGDGFFLLERHLERLAASADYFGHPWDPETVRRRLSLEVESAGRPQRVRLLLAADGTVTVESTDLEPDEGPVTVAFSRRPIDSTDRFLFHKTTHRHAYEEAGRGLEGVDDVLLWNERGEVTESTIANLLVERRGELVTPPIDSGLLPGTLRAELLACGDIREAVLHRDDVLAADAIYLLNSVRGRRSARLIEPTETLAADTP